MINRIEALADALSSLCDAANPSSESYHARNPILLRAFSPKHARTTNGYRIFKTWVAGYENALLDLRIKCEGRSNRARLDPSSQLIELITTYGYPGYPSESLRYVLRFLRKALADESLGKGLKLSYFIEEGEPRELNSKGTPAQRVSPSNSPSTSSALSEVSSDCTRLSFSASSNG